MEDRQELGAPCVWVPSSPADGPVRRRDGYRRVVAFRPAIVNWRTMEADVDLRVDVVRELGTRLGSTAAAV